MVIKRCSVSICQNTIDTSNKIFLHVPRNPESQKKWRIAMKLPETVLLTRSNVVCEDHFDLEKDAANWMYYKTIGKKLFLKPEVVPHKYIESPPPTILPSSFSESARKRKLDTLEYCNQLMDYTYSRSKKATNEEEQLLDYKKPRIKSEVSSTTD